MARATFKVTFGQSLGEGQFAAEAGPTGDVAATLDTTAVDAAVAVLVADGASPTQAHVTTLNSAWGTLLTAITAQQAATSGDAILSLDTTNVPSLTKLKRAFDRLLQSALNSGKFTA